MSGFVDGENGIFDVLQAFKAEDLDFVVVGGYGVSAYRHRFSVDADLVIQSEDLDRFAEVLEENGFEKDTDRNLVYSGRYLAYVNDQELLSQSTYQWTKFNAAKPTFPGATATSTKTRGRK